MCHALLQDPKFFQLLIRIDEELAAQARAGGCLCCEGVLHCANYPRKPRGCLSEAQDDYDTRFSFCCSVCRKRCTSMSVASLGGASIWGWRWCWCLPGMPGRSPAAARLEADWPIPMRTLQRWRQWWQSDFAADRRCGRRSARASCRRSRPVASRRTARTLYWRGARGVDAAAGLSHAAHRPLPDRTSERGVVITRRGCR